MCTCLMLNLYVYSFFKITSALSSVPRFSPRTNRKIQQVMEAGQGLLAIHYTVIAHSSFVGVNGRVLQVQAKPALAMVLFLPGDWSFYTYCCWHRTEDTNVEVHSSGRDITCYLGNINILAILRILAGGPKPVGSITTLHGYLNEQRMLSSTRTADCGTLMS